MLAALAPIVIALIAFLLRIVNLGRINSFIFDEVYYVDGARDLLKFGVEVSGSKPDFIVHPPLGKWLIGAGIKVFGDSAFGWRIASAIAGTAMILLVARIVHKLFRDTFLTGLASGLMALDGLALVHSRTALLDNFLALFILLATLLFISKQYWWTGVVLGCAMATKWSALYFVIAFGAIGLYRAFTHHSGRALIKPTAQRVMQFGLIPIAVYISSWIGWFASNRGWDRNHSSNVFSSFIYYHREMLGFHTGLVEKHSYDSNPWGWMILARPTSFFYGSPKGCGAKSCSQEVLALGTPFLWWLGTVAVIVVFGLWIRSAIMRRVDPALTIIVTGMAAGYLPWFFFQKRTVFSFYAIAFEPFVILALVYCARALKSNYGRTGEFLLASLITLIFLNFIYFLPLYMGEILTYDAWHARMWFTSWI